MTLFYSNRDLINGYTYFYSQSLSHLYLKKNRTVRHPRCNNRSTKQSILFNRYITYNKFNKTNLVFHHENPGIDVAKYFSSMCLRVLSCIITVDKN